MRTRKRNYQAIENKKMNIFRMMRGRGDGIISSVKKGEQDVTVTVTETPGKIQVDKASFIGECCILQRESFPGKTTAEILASCDAEWKKMFPEDEQDRGDQYPPKPEYPQKPKSDNEPDDGRDKQLQSGRHIYSFDCIDGGITLDKENMNFDATNGDNRYHAVAVIGDRFYKNKFLSYAELSKSYHMMDNKVHDIDHHGTTCFDGHPSIEYIVGYQKNTVLDPVSKKMSTDIIIDPHAPKYEAWSNYVRNCKNTGRTPNVSISFWATSKLVTASELPKNVNYGAYGYTDNDVVEYLYDIDFVALSTVLQGACDDKMGCGIGVNMTDENMMKETMMKMNLELKKLKSLKEEI